MWPGPSYLPRRDRTLVNQRLPRPGPGKLAAACIFAGTLVLGTLVCVAVGDESIHLLADEISKASDSSATGDMAATDSTDTAAADADATPAATPAATPMNDTGEDTLSTPDLNPPATESGSMSQLATPPNATPFQEPPLPEASPSPTPEEEQTTNETALAENRALQAQFSEWDLANVQSPTFLSSAINDFGERPLMLTGKWSVKPHLSIGTFYDGNIFLRNNQNGGAQSDFITRLSPGLTMRVGDDDSPFYMAADYTLGLDYYLQNPNQSTVDNDGRLQFQWSLPKTVIGFNVSVSQDTGQDVDVTDRVQREMYDAGLTASYTLSEKTSVDTGVDYTRSDFNGLISSSQWQGDVFFNYQYSPKTQVGVGATAGIMEVPGASNQDFQEINLRTTYRATGKITLIAEAGAQLRELGGGEGDSLTPVFSLNGAWDARPGTQLSLTATRSIYASAILNDQNYTATAFDFTIRQRITDYVDVSLGAGYVNTSYSATAAGVDATREDNYFYVRPAVEWKALSWLGVGIFYEYSQDVSQGAGGDSNFTRDRGGVDITILF
jgi:hypothetical protein